MDLEMFFGGIENEEKRARFETWYKLTADSILLENAADVIRRRNLLGVIVSAYSLPIIEDAAKQLSEEAKKYA